MILGLTGEKLSGKDTAAQYFIDNYGAFHVRHSHILDDILRLLDLPISRRNEIDLGMSLRKTFGTGILGAALRKRVLESKAEFIIINGIRFQDEMVNAHELGAEIVYITAPEDIRYQRFLKRQEKADDAQMSLEQFRVQEQEPTEIGIPALGAQADYKIENIGSSEDFFAKLDEIMRNLKNL